MQLGNKTRAYRKCAFATFGTFARHFQRYDTIANRERESDGCVCTLLSEMRAYVQRDRERDREKDYAEFISRNVRLDDELTRSR